LGFCVQSSRVMIKGPAPRHYLPTSQQEVAMYMYVYIVMQIMLRERAPNV
jgi:hypothetical protein